MSNPTTNPHDAPSFVLVGPLRAGTTLLHLMLNSHPEIASIGEFEESVAMLDEHGWPDLDHYRTWLAQHRVAVSRQYETQPDTKTYHEQVTNMWHQLASPHTKPVIGCTIHSKFDRVRDLWPNTKFIHIIRDPRDVANSCVGMGWVGHPAIGAALWNDPVTRWSRMVDGLVSEDWVMVRYEDLLKNPEIELGRCCSLLGLAYHPEMLGFFKTSTYQPLDPKLAEQWRRKMSPRTAEIIDAICMPMMNDYGYEPSVPDPKPAHGLENLQITFNNRLGRLRWRINRYGLKLVITWALVKRLGLDHPRRVSAMRRINEIDTAHLR